MIRYLDPYGSCALRCYFKCTASGSLLGGQGGYVPIFETPIGHVTGPVVPTISLLAAYPDPKSSTPNNVLASISFPLLKLLTASCCPLGV